MYAPRSPGSIREAVIAAALTALMILLFLGSWRSTVIIAISIPLSILTSVIVLSLIGETINTMTLGGLALAVGILVDDATVTIENIERFLENGYELREAILDGAAQIAVPALVSTLCICIVFLPMFFLNGVARYLFAPLAEAVMFAMIASYILSRTLVPTLAMYLLRPKEHGASRNPLVIFQRGFEAGFERVRGAYQILLTRLVFARKLFVPAFLGVCLCGFLLLPFLGQDFFPSTDSGEFILHMRAKTGTRIEETARLADQVEASIRSKIPGREVNNILDNLGLPYSPYNTMHLTSGIVGAEDGDILVSLNEDHHPTANYVRQLRKELPREFPGTEFYFLPADITTQILNFGLPAPIDIQLQSNDVVAGTQQATAMLDELRQGSRSDRPSHSTTDGLSDTQRESRSNQGGTGRLYRPRCGGEHAEQSKRELSDHTDVLSQLQEWSGLQSRRADAAISHEYAAGYPEHSH